MKSYATTSARSAKCKISSASAARIQPKLKIGHVNDPLEKEADATAEKVMKMELVKNVSNGEDGIQRKCAQCEEEEMLQPKHAAGFSQAGASVQNNYAGTALTNSIQSGQGNGSAIDQPVKSFMESRFGTDFSEIKIHTDPESISMNTTLNSRAFTVGNDIFFNQGEYNPGSEKGKYLLAHELTHTIQQSGGSAIAADRFSMIQQKISSAPLMISKGEKWDAFWGVGPWDAYKASEIAKYALDAAKKTGLPGIHNGPADAWRHCFWNCEMTEELGRDQAKFVADNHEEHGSGPAVENLMDARNNWEGRECGSKGGVCDLCCQSKLDSGSLDIIVAGKMVPSQKVARTGTAQGPSYYNE